MTHTTNTALSAPPAGLRIRRATPADAELISTLGAETFMTSFGAQNTPENLAKHLAKAFAEEIQMRELTDPAVTYLIPEVNGRTAGYAQVREGDAPACVTGRAPVEVRRFYVVADFHGTGIAQALMNACADEARRRGGGTLWLGVWDQNPRAIRFYTKWGFEDVGGQTFMLGDDPQQDRVLARSLEAGAEPRSTAS
jgi:diamine N-acetyltransferase